MSENRLTQRKVSDLEVHPYNLEIYGKADVGLKESLATHGLQQPISIDKQNRILSGARRFRAAQALGWETIDCGVVNGQRNEADTKLYIIVANDYRGEKSQEIQYREATALRELLASGALSKTQAKRMAVEKGTAAAGGGEMSEPGKLGARASGISPDTYERLDYVLGDGAREDIAAAEAAEEITTKQAEELLELAREKRAAVKREEERARSAAAAVRRALAKAKDRNSKTADERRIEAETDVLMGILRKVRQSRDALHQLRTMNPRIRPRIAMAIAGCVAEMVMTIESITTRHRIEVPRDRAKLAKLATLEDADVLSVE